MAILLPRCGFNRHTHRAIIYGPRSLGGANFRHLHVEQGTQQVLYFLNLWRLSSTVGRALRCTMAWLQLSVGVSYPVLEHPMRPLPHMESLWVASMRQFLGTTRTTIQLDNPTVPTVQREHDTYVMDYILTSNHYTPAEIRRLNYCRLFVDVVTVSDFTLPCGIKTDVAKVNGHPTSSSSRNSHLAVHQAKPSPSEWRLWRRACLLWSDINGNLRQPLGKWLVAPAQQRQHSFAYVLGEHLWIRQDAPSQYRTYRRYAADEGFHALQRMITIEQIPDKAVPALVEQPTEADVWMLMTPPTVTFRFQPPPSPSPINSFSDFVNTLPPWELELLQYTEISGEPFDFCEDLQPQMRAVSDGSVRHETQGAFGWSIRNESGIAVASGMGPARGGGCVTSYRAEAYGLLSLVRFLIRIAEYTEMQLPWIGIIATDSSSLLDTLFGHDPTRLERE